jgi:hypothetical protein
MSKVTSDSGSLFKTVVSYGSFAGLQGSTGFGFGKDVIIKS